ERVRKVQRQASTGSGARPRALELILQGPPPAAANPILTPKSSLTGYVAWVIITHVSRYTGYMLGLCAGPRTRGGNDERMRAAGGPIDTGTERRCLARAILAGDARGDHARGGPPSTDPRSPHDR